MQHCYIYPRLEAANDVDDVEKLDGVLVQEKTLVGDGGVFALLHRGSRLKADHLPQDVLRWFRHSVHGIVSVQHEGVLGVASLHEST